MDAVAPPQRSRRAPVLVVGTVVWLASELMFFAGLFAAYFTLRAAEPGPWPPADVELETGLAGAATVVLVVSSGTIQLAAQAVAAGRRPELRRWLGVTMLLAGVFLANQGREWAAADFSPDSHAYGSAFFVMTGFHGLHVLGGVLAMAVLLWRSRAGVFDARQTPAVEVVSYYWHLVDVVWLGMFATLFLLR